MTEPTSPALDADTRARVEQLSRRQGRISTAVHSADKTTKRRGMATGTRIAAVGLGGTTMFGIMAALALADTDASSPPPAPAQSQPIVLVIHTNGPSQATAPAPALVASAPAVSVEAGNDAPQPVPVELRAQPVVTTVELQAAGVDPGTDPAPVAKTNGSR